MTAFRIPPMTPSIPDPFTAAWADQWFQDRIGLGMVLNLNGIRQCFRWIPPGPQVERLARGGYNGCFSTRQPYAKGRPPRSNTHYRRSA